MLEFFWITPAIPVLLLVNQPTYNHATPTRAAGKGHIIESGRHNALLIEKGLYYAMWRQKIEEKVGV